MNLNNNKHYTNEHGMELKDFMLKESPETWVTICGWSALKYHIRAGKKEGESLEKDLGKRDDYVNEMFAIDDSYSLEEIYEELDEIKTAFENYKGE